MMVSHLISPDKDNYQIHNQALLLAINTLPCSFTKHGRDTQSAVQFKMSALSLHLFWAFQQKSLYAVQNKAVQLSMLSLFSAFALPILSMGIKDTPKIQILDSDMIGPKPPPTPDRLSLGTLSCFLGRCSSKRHFSKVWNIWSVTWSFGTMSAGAWGHTFRSLGIHVNV